MSPYQAFQLAFPAQCEVYMALVPPLVVALVLPLLPHSSST